LIVNVVVILLLEELLVAIVTDLIQILDSIVTYNVGSTVFALELLAFVDCHSVGTVVAPPVLLRMDWMMIATSFGKASSEAT
jgi:hypothetical protein